MAKRKEGQEPENLEGQTVKIKIPVYNEGIVESWEVKEVSAELANEQLSLPKEQRNAHWRHVQYNNASNEEKE